MPRVSKPPSVAELQMGRRILEDAVTLRFAEGQRPRSIERAYRLPRGAAAVLLRSFMNRPRRRR